MRVSCEIQPSVLLNSNGNASPNVTALMMIAAGDEDEDSDQDIDGQPEPLFPKVQTGDDPSDQFFYRPVQC